MNNCNTVVLLATYNGEKYLNSQIDSILNQTTPTLIVARDDGSTDNTLDILRSYKDIVVLNDLNFEFKSPSKTHYFAPYIRNFSILCEYALTIESAKYFYFSDQDDVWLPNKIEELNKVMVNEEIKANKPILVHCDLKIVDSELNVLHDSFVEAERLPKPETHNVPEVLYQNVATGCATGFNRALLDHLTPIDPKAAVHDFWFYLGAKLTGVTKFIPKSLVLYRQHGENSIGSTVENNKGVFGLGFYLMLLNFPKHYIQAIKQTQAMLSTREVGAIDDRLHVFINLPYLSIRKRLNAVELLFPRKKPALERLYLKVVMLIIPLMYKK